MSIYILHSLTYWRLLLWLRMSSLSHWEINSLFYCKNFFSKVVCCCFKEVSHRHVSSHWKSSSGKDQFDDGDWNGVCVRTNSINTRKEMSSKGENKLHRIMEMFIDTDAKIQELSYGTKKIHEGPTSNVLIIVLKWPSFTESPFRAHRPLSRLLQEQVLVLCPSPHPPPSLSSPLLLYILSSTFERIAIGENPTPQSSKFCPIFL